MTAAAQHNGRAPARPTPDDHDAWPGSSPAPRPTVLLAHDDPERLELLRRALHPRYDVVTARTGAAALRIADQLTVAVVIVGQTMAGPQGQPLLDELAARYPHSSSVKLMLADDPGAAAAQTPNDGQAIFYIIPPAIAADDLAAIVRGAMTLYQAATKQVAPQDADLETQVAQQQQLLDLARRLAIQHDLTSAARLTAAAIPTILGADRAVCVLYDAATGTLRIDEGNGDERRWNAASGLIGFVARTGIAVLSARIGADPRSICASDDPRGQGDERLLAAPVLRPDGGVLAVLVALRSAARPAFDDNSAATLTLLANQCAPTFGQLTLRARLEAAYASREALWRGVAPDLFRAEAIAAYSAGGRSQGHALRITPAWTRWLYWLLIAICAVGLLFASVATIDQYAAGPAVVRLEDDADTGATLIAVLPGQYRPLLQPGMPLRLELTGYRYAYQQPVIESVGDRLIGPDEARRALGPEAAAAMPLPPGPLVLVQARLPARTFTANGGVYPLYDNMSGAVEARVRSERLLLTLVPGLKGLLEQTGSS